MNRMRIASAAMIIGASVALPAMAQSATEDLYACSETADATERLACYDAAVAALRAAEETGDVVTITSDEIAEASADQFGRSLRESGPIDEKLAAAEAAAEEAEPDEVTAGIVSIGETRSGRLVVTLDNGQVWRQTDSARVSVSRRAPPETATVKKAALGSYRVKLGRAKAFRAERVD